MFSAKIQHAISGLLAWLLGFVLSIFPFWVAILTLCFFDRYVGIKAAIERGDELKKNGWRRTVDKIGIYSGWIVIGGLLQALFAPEIPEVVNIAKILAGLICWTEVDSIICNTSDYTGRDYRALLLKKIPFIGDWAAEKIPNDKYRPLKWTKKTEDTNENSDKNSL
jgi:hypothetical protein